MGPRSAAAAALQLALLAAAASAQPLAATVSPPSPSLSISAVVAVEAAQQAAAAVAQRVQQVTAEAYAAQSGGLTQAEAFSRDINQPDVRSVCGHIYIYVCKAAKHVLGFCHKDVHKMITLAAKTSGPY
jgi:hypothetical protein